MRKFQLVQIIRYRQQLQIPVCGLCPFCRLYRREIADRGFAGATLSRIYGEQPSPRGFLLFSVGTHTDNPVEILQQNGSSLVNIQTSCAVFFRHISRHTEPDIRTPGRTVLQEAFLGKHKIRPARRECLTGGILRGEAEQLNIRSLSGKKCCKNINKIFVGVEHSNLHGWIPPLLFLQRIGAGASLSKYASNQSPASSFDPLYSSVSSQKAGRIPKLMGSVP